MIAVLTPLRYHLGRWAVLLVMVVVLAETGLLAGFFLPVVAGVAPSRHTSSSSPSRSPVSPSRMGIPPRLTDGVVPTRERTGSRLT